VKCNSRNPGYNEKSVPNLLSLDRSHFPSVAVSALVTAALVPTNFLLKWRRLDKASFSLLVVGETYVSKEVSGSVYNIF